MKEVIRKVGDWLVCDEDEVIVRCKDCIYNVTNMQKDPLDITDYTDIVCTYFMTDGLERNDYCSKGAKNESNISN